MKTLALALALCFAAVPAQAATRHKVAKSHVKRTKLRSKSHVKRANKSAHLKKANRKHAA